VRFNQLRFGAAAGSHIAAMGGSTVVLSGDGYRISGNANAHINANGSGAVVDLQAESTTRPTITIEGSRAFAAAFAWARASGQIFTGTGLVFSGKANVTGRRWRAEQNSSIDSGQSGERYLPGTVAGVAVKNGEYL
jgi:thiosulfate reductase cytochrome b subunit